MIVLRTLKYYLGIGFVLAFLFAAWNKIDAKIRRVDSRLEFEGFMMLVTMPFTWPFVLRMIFGDWRRDRRWKKPAQQDPRAK